MRPGPGRCMHRPAEPRMRGSERRACAPLTSTLYVRGYAVATGSGSSPSWRMNDASFQ